MARSLREGRDAAHADAQESLALVYAAHDGRADLVELLRAGPNPARADAQESWALVLAAGRGHVDVVRCLVQGAHPARADAKERAGPRSWRRGVGTRKWRGSCAALRTRRAATREGASR